MARIWEERRPGLYYYFYEEDRTKIVGDVRSTNIDYDSPVVYKAQSYDPPPGGTYLGVFNTLQDAKSAVEKACT